MSKIAVYKSEREAGLASLITKQNSLAYTVALQDTKLSQSVMEAFLKSVANNEDMSQFDLFYLNTILVTTGWNKNDDVFDRIDVWSSRYTPIHKQFNLEHDQSKIIGHMTTAKAVNENFEIIGDDTNIDDLPDKFHILTGAVIYRHLSDPTANEQIEKIIDEIGKGEWFVSMECLFSGFDYAVTAKNGDQRIIARDDNSAFLTKHLRAYGGTGTYEDFTIGRCLRNITFSGKGLVRKPANPESIIFNEKVSAFKASFANLGYVTNTNTIQEIVMANDNKEPDSEAQVKLLTERLTQMQSDLTAAHNKIKDFESSVTTAKITALETDLSSKNEENTSLKNEIATLKNSLTEVSTKLTDAETRANKAENDLKAVNAEKVASARLSMLTDKGAPKEEAQSIVDLFKDKDDEAFATIVNIFASKWKVEEKSQSTATTKIDNEATVVVENKGGLAVNGTDDRLETTRAAMSNLFTDWFPPTLNISEEKD